jgi:hypothetical protein
MNAGIREFEDKVIDLFNTYNLPIEVKRLVAQNTLNLITKKADEIIMKEIHDGKQEKIYMKKEEK